MFGRWRKVRADRKLWRQAGSLAELGGLMARWLEGDLSVWPGYAVAGPDEETADLVPVLARLNRAGFVTDQSQPGCDEYGIYGHWKQRAAVSGLVGDEQLLNALARVAEAERLTILVRTVDEASRRPGITATTVDGEAYTDFGGHLSRSDLRHIWLGTSWAALAEIEAAWQVTLIDPVYGRTDRLWPALDEALALVTTP
ncbi:DUF6919 domain-containing protein [Streptomyces canus]|uniref:DUF6919 domain-containing protein n=1 Tax=Streptomyces canus TaxID=58343 RepID=UPI00381F73C6